MDYPRLRYVEAFPLDHGTSNAYALRDPSGLAEDVVVLSGDALFFLQYFDGKHSLLDMRVEYMRAFGRMIEEQKLANIVAELDRRHFLVSEEFDRYKAELAERMLAEPQRPASHAGQSYEADPQRLREQLDGFFLHPSGAGRPSIWPSLSGQGTGPNGQSKQTSAAARPLAAVAPHIDLRAGGPCYSHTYRALAEAEPAEVYVILGTGHSGLQNLYSVLPQDFATPLGVVRHDPEFIKRLACHHSGDLFSEPLAHRQEHTIEFQAVFLQYLFGGQHDYRIVPVLCSFAHLMLQDSQFAREKQLIEAFIHALRCTIVEDGRRICVLASVDLAHVGPRYGEKLSPDPLFLGQVSAADQQLLMHIERVDAAGLCDTIARERDRYRVCGFAPLYTLLAATEARSGKILRYDRAAVDGRNSTVTFASAVLF